MKRSDQFMSYIVALSSSPSINMVPIDCNFNSSLYPSSPKFSLIYDTFTFLFLDNKSLIYLLNLLTYFLVSICIYFLPASVLISINYSANSKSYFSTYFDNLNLAIA